MQEGQSNKVGNNLRLPSLSQLRKTDQVANEKVQSPTKESALPRSGLPKVGQGLIDKYHAARQSTLALNDKHPGLARLQQKDEDDRKRRKARMRERSQTLADGGGGGAGKKSTPLDLIRSSGYGKDPISLRESFSSSPSTIMLATGSII
eukprot:CAMPEP_0175077978 /NCGR_PEP_ID=MMETSP0052_2-20121109/23788_1 /TAXON_ID=51329 ORGANISM="Polytomella parva, Strain SAG 63-3" /NCGR_SAMPLE_ID=MMETSP0052_2 /ASSEMBLY_ACC=CAM_ASM_000194 /LENGTH=148 /DNA_ID=CAMNT_0016347699 /DNA_START=36 /DNA_END=479 /DNA_ORIENTATION=-